MIYIEIAGAFLIVIGGSTFCFGMGYFLFWYIPRDYLRDRAYGMFVFHLGLMCSVVGAFLMGLSSHYKEIATFL